MRKTKFKLFIMLAGLLALPPLLASPQPRAPLESASFEVVAKLGKVKFDLKCPGGKLTSLKATRGKQSATLPVAQLSKFKLPTTDGCSGVSTSQVLLSEADTVPVGLNLTIDFSREYTEENLLIYLDLKAFQFTNVQHSVGDVGGELKTEELQLNVKMPKAVKK